MRLDGSPQPKRQVDSGREDPAPAAPDSDRIEDTDPGAPRADPEGPDPTVDPSV